MATKDNHYTDRLVGNTEWQRRQVALTQQQENAKQAQKKGGK